MVTNFEWESQSLCETTAASVSEWGGQLHHFRGLNSKSRKVLKPSKSAESPFASEAAACYQ